MVAVLASPSCKRTSCLDNLLELLLDVGEVGAFWLIGFKF